MSCAMLMVYLNADHVSKQLASVASGLANMRYCNPGKSSELAPPIERRHR
jgi:hypothetical protein